MFRTALLKHRLWTTTPSAAGRRLPQNFLEPQPPLLTRRGIPLQSATFCAKPIGSHQFSIPNSQFSSAGARETSCPQKTPQHQEPCLFGKADPQRRDPGLRESAISTLEQALPKPHQFQEVGVTFKKPGRNEI